MAVLTPWSGDSLHLDMGASGASLNTVPLGGCGDGDQEIDLTAQDVARGSLN
jgi:hypothetical protein